MRICATSNGEQRVQVLIHGAGSARTVTETAPSDSLCNSSLNERIGQSSSCRRPKGDNEIVWKVLNAQSKYGKTGCVLKKNSQHLVKSCLQTNRYQPSARNRVRIQQRETRAERSLDEERSCGSRCHHDDIYWHLWKKKFDKNNPEMGTNSVARQMHQKTV